MKWKATSETNMNGYTVEYSKNGINWLSVAYLNAVNTGGTNQYTATHYQPQSGINYYRLKMLDKDGNISYSKTATINFSGKTGLAIYPNPVRSTLTAEMYRLQSEIVRIQIVDVTGRVIQSLNIATKSGNNVFELNTNNLSKGNYFMIVEGASKEVRQFIKE